MKKLSAFMAFLIVSLFASLYAQNLTIESVCSELSKNKITKGDFIQEKTIGKNGRTLKSSGKFIFAPDGIVWATERPFPSTLVLGKDYMIQISSDGTKKVMDASGNEAFKSVSSTLLAVFSNDVSKLNESFKVVFTSDSGNWSVVLEPKDKTVAAIMTGISLSGKSSSGNSEISTVELNESKGNKVSYTFLNQSHPKELSSDEKALFNNR